MLLELFGSLAKVIASLTRADFVGALGNLIEVGEHISSGKADPDVKGTITAVADAGKAIWDKKRKTSDGIVMAIEAGGIDKAIEAIDKVNTANVQDLLVKLKYDALVDGDFGSG